MSTIPLFGEKREREAFGLPFEVRRLPDELARFGREIFAELWSLHPEGFEVLHRPAGGKVQIPRWQVPYDRAYLYPGAPEREAPPLPSAFYPFTRWLADQVDAQLNAAVVNWYDAELGHYIGAHQDRTDQLMPGSPVVSVSLGATRCFRLSKKSERSVDIEADHGCVIVLPWRTNRGLFHSIPKPRSGEGGRRISITARAFR